MKQISRYHMGFTLIEIFLILAVLAAIYVAVDRFFLGGPKITALQPPGAFLRIRNIPAKIINAAGEATLIVLLDEAKHFGIDATSILGTAFASGGTATKGNPPDNIPVFFLINKRTNEILYWKLTSEVDEIELKNQDPKFVKLKIQNRDPLRIEMWIETDSEIEINVKMKDGKS